MTAADSQQQDRQGRRSGAQLYRALSVPIGLPHLFERFWILPVKASVYCEMEIRLASGRR